MILVTEVGVNSIINILKGNKKSLISAAKKQLKRFWMKSTKCNLALVFNCITKKRFFGENFQEELDEIYAQIDSKI